MIIYVAGPYTADTQEGIDRNVQAAREAGIEILRRGHVPLCPHTMTHNWDHGTGLEYEQFIQADLRLLARCDAILMLPGWHKSSGALGELELATRIGIPVLEDIPEAS